MAVNATGGGGGEAAETVLALDIGGTKLAAGIVTMAGEVVVEDVAATDRGEPWPGVAQLVQSILTRGAALGARPVGVGVGCGGPMAPGGVDVSPLNIPGWRRFPLRERLGTLTGLPVWIDNDAKALALGEGWLGAAAGERDYLAMVVSTGVGGGIVVDGRMLDGRLGNAGHIGHVIVVSEGGRRCACGSSGCLEAEISGPSIEAQTGRPPAEAPAEVRRRAGMLTGRAVATVAVLLDLNLAVVAGSVALGFGEPFFAAAQEELDRCCRIEFAAGATIRPAGLGAGGPLLGAAAVALAHLTPSRAPWRE